MSQGSALSFDDVFSFLRALDEASIHYGLGSFRPGALCVEISVPGERWEVEFLEDGDVWVEVFRSSGDIGGRELLEDLFERHSDGRGSS